MSHIWDWPFSYVWLTQYFCVFRMISGDRVRRHKRGRMLSRCYRAYTVHPRTATTTTSMTIMLDSFYVMRCRKENIIGYKLILYHYFNDQIFSKGIIQLSYFSATRLLPRIQQPWIRFTLPLLGIFNLHWSEIVNFFLLEHLNLGHASTRQQLGLVKSPHGHIQCKLASGPHSNLNKHLTLSTI